MATRLDPPPPLFKRGDKVRHIEMPGTGIVESVDWISDHYRVVVKGLDATSMACRESKLRIVD